MQNAKHGDTVRVHFTGSYENGTPFATTVGEDPLELTIGDGKLIACFEESIIGMEEGERRTVHVEPANALGERRPELISTLPRHTVPEQYEDLKVGSSVQIKDDNGNDIKATVTELSDQNVTIDANHPLAGETLTFDIELIEFV
jgi:peptidylprolyl isomerase